MDFFKNLSKLLTDSHLTINVKGGANHITVSLLPIPNLKEAKTQLIPIIISGTPEEVDAEFFNIISQPLELSSQAISNVASFEQGIISTNKVIADKKAAALKAKTDKENAKKVQTKTQVGLPLATAKKAVVEDDEEEEEEEEETEEGTERGAVAEEEELQTSLF